MPSPLKKAISTRTYYSVDNPEDGCFWHALDKTGLALFDRKDLNFGKKTTETTGMSGFSDKKIIRCRPNKEGLRAFVKKDGAILSIPKDELAPSDYCTAGGREIFMSCREPH